MENRRAAAYIRVSTEEQLEFSPDSQLKKIREYAAHNGMELIPDYIFSDDGISGRKAEKRPAFMQMIALAKRKPRLFDTVLVWKFSRFARSREDSIVYKSMLRRECGIEVISVSEQLGDDNVSILIEALLEAMDEYYSINLAEEVRRGMREKFTRGGVVSQPPFGYDAVDGAFRENENAEHVRAIFAQFIGGAGLRTIAAGLNRAGVRTRRGCCFESRTVEYILTNPTYIGKSWRRGADGGRCCNLDSAELVDGAHAAIITPEQFAEAGELLKKRRTAAASDGRGEASDFALRGLVRCSACGATLTQAVKGSALQCYRYARGQCERSHCISLPALTEAVLAQLCRDFGEVRISVRTKPPALSSFGTVNIAQEKKRLERLRRAYEDGIDTLEEYRTRKAEILRRIEGAEKPTTTVGAVTELDGTLRELLPTLPAGALNAALRAVCRKIVFNSGGRFFEMWYFEM